MTVQRLYLLRHGQIPQSSPARFVGQRDLPLDEEGRRQAEAVRESLATLDLARVVSSDLRRTMETAEIVCRGRSLAIEPEPGLREISLGEWEGLAMEEVRQRFPGQYEIRGQDIAGFRPPGGESFEDLQARAWPAFESIAATEGDALVVAHAGVIRVLICRILGLPLAQLFRLGQTYCGLSVIQLKEGEYLLDSMNSKLFTSSPV